MSLSKITSAASSVINGAVSLLTSSPLGPAPAPAQPQSAPAGPDGLAGRASQGGDMAPRQNLTLALTGAPGGPGGPSGPSGPNDPPKTPMSTADLSKAAANVGNEANKAAMDDGGQAMQNVLKANMMNMEFQANMGIISMQKGMVEAVAKTIKDIGTKTAQLAG